MLCRYDKVNSHNFHGTAKRSYDAAYVKLKFIAFIGLYPLDAYAYFDPGTGSLLMQLVIALVAGGAIFLRNITGKISVQWQKFKKISLPVRSKHAVLAALVGMFTAVFYSSNNSDTLTMPILLSNIVSLVIFSVLSIATLALLLKNLPSKNTLLNGAILAMCIYYLRFPFIEIIAIVLNTVIAVILCALFIIAITAFIWIWRRNRPAIGHQEVVFCLALVTLVPTYEAVIATIDNNQSKKRGTALHDTVLRGVDTKFHQQPNVYFFILDSYTSIAALKILGLAEAEEIAPFYPALQDRGFTIYPEFFTNFQSTRYAIASYFNMDLKHRGSSIYRLQLSDLQEIVASVNPVYRIFSDNDYDINRILIDDYLVGDRCQTCLLGTQQKKRLRYFELFDKIVTQDLLKTMSQRTDHAPALPVIFRQQSPYYDGIESKTHLMLRYLADKTNESSSYLMYVHFYLPLHTDHNRRCDEKYEIQKYAVRLFDTHRVVLAEIEKITAKDKHALIILAGDHGPYIFNRCARDLAMRTNAEIIEQQGAFLAIKWGHDYDGRYDKDIKSSANLFRYIFSYLMEHEQLLANKPDDDAFYLTDGKIVKSIDDGAIIAAEQ